MTFSAADNFLLNYRVQKYQAGAQQPECKRSLLCYFSIIFHEGLNPPTEGASLKFD